jgi:serine/threonine protein kinase
MPTVGNYDVLEKIAEGGTGAIHRGRQRTSGQIVAVKVVPPSLASNPVLRERFEQTFLLATRLNHPNIVRALECGKWDGSLFLIMEFIEGESLAEKTEREGRIAETDAVRIIVQVARGLHYVHEQHLVHRAVKPNHILVGNDGVAKLTGFELAQEADADLKPGRTPRGLGTPGFLAPEQVRNAGKADIRSDIYCLGIVLYRMVTGAFPFQSSGPLDTWMKKTRDDLVPPRASAPHLTERVNRAILRALKADLNQRPPSCREFEEDLVRHAGSRLPPDSISDIDPEVK